jgi:hypothetical protein
MLAVELLRMAYQHAEGNFTGARVSGCCGADENDKENERA